VTSYINYVALLLNWQWERRADLHLLRCWQTKLRLSAGPLTSNPIWAPTRKDQRLMVFIGNPMQSCWASPAIWDHTPVTWHVWMRFTITLPEQANTPFIYATRLKGCVDLSVDYIPRMMVYLFADSHPSK